MPFSIAAPIIGGLLGAGGAMSAGNTQANAAGKASGVQWDMFATTQRNLQPWLQSGQEAQGQINQGLQPGGQFNHMFNMQDFQQSPAYQFNLQQGQQAIDKASNARGNFYAPQTLQDTAKFSQGLASNEFQNAFNNYQTGVGNIWSRLSNVSGAGQNAATNLGGFGAGVAANVGNNIIGAGNAQAAGQVGAVNNILGGMGGAYNAYTQQQALQQQQQPTVDPNQYAG